jgi:hypothetical protein
VLLNCRRIARSFFRALRSSGDSLLFVLSAFLRCDEVRAGRAAEPESGAPPPRGTASFPLLL